MPFSARDAVWHVPGDNPVSGPYRGVDAIRTTMPARKQPLDAWTIDVLDVMGNDDLVVGVVHVHGRRRGREIDTRGFSRPTRAPSRGA